MITYNSIAFSFASMESRYAGDRYKSFRIVTCFTNHFHVMPGDITAISPFSTKSCVFLGRKIVHNVV